MRSAEAGPSRGFHLIQEQWGDQAEKEERAWSCLCFKKIETIKKQIRGASPVAQRLSSYVPLLGGPGFAGSDPGCRHGTAWQPCCGRRPTYKNWRKMGTYVSSEPGFLSNKRRTGSS